MVARTETPETLARHAARCGTTPGKLRRMLRGDLDTIVAKALKKNAPERYASVTALADDLRRFAAPRADQRAAGHAAAIGPRKFVRRHVRRRGDDRGGRAAARRLDRRSIRAGSRPSATARSARRTKAAKVSELLTGLLTGADPYATRATRGEPTVRGLLDAGAERVQKELAGQPELQAEILTVMGRIYRRLGVYDKAQPLLEQALVGRTPGLRAGARASGPELNDLGVLLSERATTRHAARNLEQALSMRRKLLGPEHADVAITLVELGRVYQDQGFNERAEPLQREALAIRRKVLGDEHRETATSLSDLASVLRLNGDLAGAESLLRQCLEIEPQDARRGSSEHRPRRCTISALIAGDAGATILPPNRCSARPWSCSRKALGDEHPIVAATLNSLSRALRRTGSATTKPRPRLQDALNIALPALGSDHQLVAIYTINLASVQLARNEAAAAEALLRQALPIRIRAPGIVPSRRRTFAEDDWSVGATKSLLGAALTAQARYDEAEAVLLDANRDFKDLPGPKDRDARTTLTRLVALYEAWGRPDKAAPRYRAAPDSSVSARSFRALSRLSPPLRRLRSS